MLNKNSKSGLKEEIDEALIDKILSFSKNQDTTELIEMSLENLDYNTLDTVYHEGDVTINGNFDTFKANMCNIIINGDLHIDGTLITYDDPETLVFVTGSIYANNVVNSGLLIVNQNLILKNALIGDYNHGGVTVFGDTKAVLFYPENHHFDLTGSITFDYAFGNHYRLNESENHKVFNLDWDLFKKSKPKFNLSFIELFEIDETLEDDEIEAMEDFIKHKTLIKYIENNNFILK